MRPFSTVCSPESAQPSGSRQAAAEYYGALTALYRWYGGTAHGWHYGIHDGAIKGHSRSLTRGNEVLLEGLLASDTTALDILDVGCGEGGLSVWAAQRGHRVVGVTVSVDHARLAAALAVSRRVSERCRFLVADMDAMPFDTESLDVVVNQETWCHSQSKADYAKGAFRVLRPGGIFRSTDLSLARCPDKAAERRQYCHVLDGFQVPSLITAAEAGECLRAAGFIDVSVIDLTQHAARSARLMLTLSVGPYLLDILGLGAVLYGSDDRIARYYHRHVLASMAFNRGLLHGLFSYLLASGRKPS